MTSPSPQPPDHRSRYGRSAYALLGAGIAIAVVALILVLVLRDGGSQNVATIDPTTQPTATADGDGAAGGDATVTPAPTASAAPDATATPTAAVVSPTAIPPTPRPTQPPAAPPATPTVTPTTVLTTVQTTVPKLYPVVSLVITITHPDVAPVTYGVACNGTESTATCQALARSGVHDRLVNGAPSNQICTEIYGGPDVARVVGSYDGRAVDTTVDRTNGCGIHDWDVVLAGILRPARGATPPPTPAPGTGRVTGHVLATPTCPVQREGEVCPPAPVDGIVEFSQAGRVIATARTDASGAYSLGLAPGDYAVSVDVGNTPFPTCQSTTVKAAAGRTTVADVDCDTGIR